MKRIRDVMARVISILLIFVLLAELYWLWFVFLPMLEAFWRGFTTLAFALITTPVILFFCVILFYFGVFNKDK